MKQLFGPSKIEKDDRGWVLFPITDEELEKGKIKNLHLVSITPSEIRGNHYHLEKTEYQIIFGGEVQIAIQDLNKNTTVNRQEVDCSTPMVLEVGPQVVHAIKNISSKVVFLLCYGTMAYDKGRPDVVRKLILE